MHEPGSVVTHAKLPELGTGEVIAHDRGTVRIRFASGERSFLMEVVAPHLSVSLDAPPQPAPAKRARAAARSKR